MELINGTDRLPAIRRPLYLALGNFDGVHRGHQEIIRSAVREARENYGCAAALIFDPHPVMALQPRRPLSLLTDIADRAEIMSGLGVDYLLVEAFTREFSSLTAEQFIRKILVEKLDTQKVFVGSDYTFGQRGTGNIETLRYWGGQLGFKVTVSRMLEIEGRQISSSLIRSLILSGSVKEASELLNYFFFRQGKVVRGHGIGGRLLYPTANIAVSPHLLLPGRGVYLTAVTKLSRELLYGVTNVGCRPTFARHEPAVETHILDFDSSIYNRDIRICFLEKLRDTRKFASAPELKQQIDRDIGKSRSLIEKLKPAGSGQPESLQAGCSVLRS